MTIPVITFFNNKGGVGKTSLVYHLAWMLSDLGHRVLACDLDPQTNLTAAFLNEGHLEQLWDESDASPESGITIFECVEPLMQVGDLKPPCLQPILTQPSLFQGDIGTNGLRLIPGDLALAEFEDILSAEWPNALGSSNLFRPFRILTAFSTIMQTGASTMKASIILADVGPNLGAINRSALIASDLRRCSARSRFVFTSGTYVTLAPRLTAGVRTGKVGKKTGPRQSLYCRKEK